MTETLVVEKNFLFTDSRNTEDFPSSLSVKIKETIEAEFGSYVWPSSVVLAQYLWHNRKELSKKSFIEIGSGTALPSIVAYKSLDPTSVFISDKICKARDSLQLNGISDYTDHFISDRQSNEECQDDVVHLLPLHWGEVSYELIKLQSKFQPEIILASDCFYDPNVFEPVLSTVYYLLKSYAEANQYKRSGKFYCAYQTRCLDWSIADLLQKWNLRCHYIPLQEFAADNADIASSGLPGRHTIQFLEITLNK